MSLSVSSRARLSPTTSAGRAMGRATRQNAPQRVSPSERAASIKCAGWVMNMARAVIYT